MKMISTLLSEPVRSYIEDHSRFPEASHDAVLRRLLGIEVKSESPKKRHRISRVVHRRGQITPQPVYELPLLKILLAVKDRRLPVQEVLRQIKQQMVLGPADFRKTKSGVARWKTHVSWTRARLVKRGLLCPPEQSGTGNWQLTAKGVREARKPS